MRGRLDLTTRFPVMKVLVDFDNLGFSQIAQWSDITDYVMDISGSKEKESEVLGGASSDLVTITLENMKNAFSKDNPDGPFYGKIRSNLRFALQTGFESETLTNYVIGYVESFKPRWKGKEIILTATCPMKKLKKTPVPTLAYQDISWDELVHVLLDEAGIDSFFVRNIPKTEFFFKYFKFEESNCFDALKKLMEMAVGQAYFEGDKFVTTTKLALDYTLDTTEKHDIIVDDLFEFEENVDSNMIVNKVSIESNYKEIAPLQVIWETPENFVRVQNEQTTYDGSSYVYIDSANLPLYWSEEEDITIKNITTGADVEWDVYNAELGRVHLTAVGVSNVSTGDLLSISYTYQQLVLLPGEQRRFVANLEEEVYALHEPDVVAWNADATAQVPYSEVATTPNSLARQSLSLSEDGMIVELVLLNNTADKVSISTLQLRGNPVKVLNPIEVHNKDLPSINEFETQEVSIQNNYINNIKLAEKISQYLIDNNAQPRKNINIQIPGYPEMLLNDVAKVVESNSGTNHKFTVERIDFSFSTVNGWTVDLTLVELDTVQWVYQAFSGDSYGKINRGVGTVDFIKEINANMVSNGGAELYSGADDESDIGAIGQLHIIPDYWSFTRLTGDATARVREGGNLVLHGKHSFEITTTNGGTGYFSQIIPGIKPSNPYTLSLLAKAESCTGKAIIEQYNSASTLLKTDEVVVSNYTQYEISLVTEVTTETIIVKLQKESGGGTNEECWFDKVKLENSSEASPYIETEETTAVQIGKPYANSVTIGNQYGIEVFDENNNLKVRMGQYEPGVYGLKIYGGAIEIVNGLPADQVNIGSGTTYESGYDPSAKIEFYYGDTEPADKTVLWVDTSGTEDVWKRWDENTQTWKMGPSGPQGVPGPDGADGQTLYTWIKYADDALGNGMSELPTDKKYIGLSYNNASPSESSDPNDYTWSLIQGDQGPQGPSGENGETYYTWIKYADDAIGTGITDDPTGKAYIGISYNNLSQTESQNPAVYTWSKILGPQGPQGPEGQQGEQGPQGIQGPPGDDGQTYWTWIKYADTPTTGMSDSPVGKTYMGIAYNKTTATESTIYADYEWSLIKGEQGVQGPPGEDGATTYTWIKYADDVNGTNMSDDPAGKQYLGIAYNKTTATESTVATDYAWSPLFNEQLKTDLRMTAPLPTSLAFNENGITATATSGGYARLDYRGLYINGGAIQIDGGLPDDQVAGASSWNRQGTYIDADGIYTGSISADQINGGTITGITVQTAYTGERVVMTGNAIRSYNSDGSGMASMQNGFIDVTVGQGDTTIYAGLITINDGTRWISLGHDAGYSYIEAQGTTVQLQGSWDFSTATISGFNAKFK